LRTPKQTCAACAELVEVCGLEVLDASTLRHFDKLSASQAQHKYRSVLLIAKLMESQGLIYATDSRSKGVYSLSDFRMMIANHHGGKIQGWAKAVRDIGKEFELTTALPAIRMLLKHRMVGKFRGNYVPINEIHWTELAHPTRLPCSQRNCRYSPQ